MNNVIAPIPGVVLDIKVKVGQQVTKNEVVMILEAMKMENQIVAPCAGTVSTINVRVGESVPVDSVMMTITE